MAQCGVTYVKDSSVQLVSLRRKNEGRHNRSCSHRLIREQNGAREQSKKTRREATKWAGGGKRDHAVNFVGYIKHWYGAACYSELNAGILDYFIFSGCGHGHGVVLANPTRLTQRDYYGYGIWI